MDVVTGRGRPAGWIVAAAATLAGVPAGVALSGGAVDWAGAGPLAAALAGLVLVARRWPVAALGLSVGSVASFRTAGLVDAGWVWPATATFVVAVLGGRGRWAYWLGAGAVASAVAWESGVAGHPPEWVAARVGIEALWLAAVLAGATAVRDRRRWQAEAAARLRQSLHEREVDAARRRAEERVRIARELHDVVAHTLAVVGVHVNVALDALHPPADGDPAGTDGVGEAVAALRVAQDVRAGAMTDLRALVRVLRDDGDDDGPAGRLDGLGELVRRAGIAVRLDEAGDRRDVPAPVALAAYRIVQEALTNTVRHAAATRADVVLRYERDAVTIAVTDDGAGGDPDAGGHGVAGMRERVAALGGTLTAGPGEHGGFAVRATIPTGV